MAEPLKVEVAGAQAPVPGEPAQAEAVPVPVKLARAEVVRASMELVAQGSPCFPACSKGAQAKRLLAQ